MTPTSTLKDLQWKGCSGQYVDWKPNLKLIQWIDSCAYDPGDYEVYSDINMQRNATPQTIKKEAADATPQAKATPTTSRKNEVERTSQRRSRSPRVSLQPRPGATKHDGRGENRLFHASRFDQSQRKHGDERGLYRHGRR